jgi:hypothetical protein
LQILRVLSNDPASSGDAFGTCGLEGTWPEKKIRIKYVKEHYRDKTKMDKLEFYNQINLELLMIKDMQKINVVVIEKNYDYEDLYEVFNHPLNPRWVQTCSSLTDKNRDNENTMDKNFTVKWLVQNISKITIPSNADERIKELINQNLLIDWYRTPSGKKGYKARSGRHDDVWSAELLGLDVIRKWWAELDP